MSIHRDRITIDRNYFLSRSIIDRNGCWLWQLHVNPHGYGEAHKLSRRIRAHRLCYEALVEKIEEGDTVDHICGVKSCVNPEHLQVLSHSDHLKLEHKRGIYKNHLTELNGAIA